MAIVQLQLPSGQAVTLTGNHREASGEPLHVPRIGEQVVYDSLTYEVEDVRTDVQPRGGIQTVTVIVKRSD